MLFGSVAKRCFLIVLFWNRALLSAALIAFLKWAKVGLMLNSCVTGKEDKVEERKHFLSSLLLLPSAWGWGGQCGRQGVTKRCRLSWLTNRALVYTSPNAGGWGVAGSQPISTAVHITWHGAKIYFGDLTPYLTYDGRLPSCMRRMCTTIKSFFFFLVSAKLTSKQNAFPIFAKVLICQIYFTNFRFSQKMNSE